MDWVESIGHALSYIEENITQELSIKQIARQALLSPFYFQKGFAMLCGFTVGDYIRRRRLTLAASELLATEEKIIDIAIKYGYDAPDSFTKAFTRFHGVTPTAVRREGAMIKSFAPLKIKLTLKGGHIMDYKIVKKEQFTIIGMSKVFKYEQATAEVPKLWGEYHQSGKSKVLCGLYGVNIDESMSGDTFEYLIADNYNPAGDVPEGLVTKVIPAHTWAVFPCVGPMPQTIQQVNQKIFSEWLPACADYEIAAGYNIEMYGNPVDFKKGLQDDKYYCEIWIPVKKK